MKKLIKNNFDFYYGKEAEQFNFFRIPKLLFTDKRFLGISAEAKVLYGLMLDRMSLSVKNGWFDEENHVYIYFKISDAMEYMSICKDKAIKLFAELDDEKGCGLIKKKRQGLGKPSMIYVMNFNSGTYEEKEDEEDINADMLQRSEKQTSVWSEISISRGLENRHQEVDYSDSKENDFNNNKNIYTDLSETYPIPSYQMRVGEKNTNVIDAMREREEYTSLISQNIEYELVAKNYNAEVSQGILDIMVDVVCSRKAYLVIAGDEIPQVVVKSRLLKLNYEHIEYVLDCLKQNTSKVKNIKSYLLTALYNSFSTIDHYYRAEVNHDFYGLREENM